MTAGDGPEIRLIIDPIDPRRPKAGGIDTCIRGLVKYCPRDLELRIVGVDAVGDAELGVWRHDEIDGRGVLFMPVTRTDVTRIRPLVPHVVKLVAGLVRHRRKLTGMSTYQSHRLTTGLAVRRLFRGRQVQFVHNDGVDNLKAGSESYFTRQVRLYRWLERMAVQHCQDVVVFNRSGADRLRGMGTVVRFSPTWFDEEHFRPAERRRADGVVRVLTVGRLDPSKDPVLAIRGIAAAPRRFTLTMVGSGSLQTEVEEEIAALGLGSRVRLAGLLPKAEVAAVMREHDLLLMTSQYEGYPRTVVEALACGLPVATTDGGEPNGLVVEGLNGSRIDGRAPDSVAAALERAALVPLRECVDSVASHRASAVVPVVLGRVPVH